MATTPLTLLHLSDTQFGLHHRFGNPSDEPFDKLLTRLLDDLQALRKDHGLQAQAVLLTGDLAEWGMEDEFADVLEFAAGLSDKLAIPRHHIVIIPGNHDINRDLCDAYFKGCKARRKDAQAPYWAKWEFFAQFFNDFYQAETGIEFTEAEPWTLFEMPELKLVVAGLNSTMKESHLEEEEQDGKRRYGHYGWLGENQLRWFAKELEKYREQGWFRIAALHHNVRRGPVQDDENLRDVEDFNKYLGGLVNLIVHGHTHDGKADWLSNKVPILATGSAALKAPQRPEETPNQYQILQLWPDRYQRWTRCYYPKAKTWGGDNRATHKHDAWQAEEKVPFANIQATFPAGPPGLPDEPSPQPPATPKPESILTDREIQGYRNTLQSHHHEIELAGFKTKVRVLIDVDELHVPLRAMVDLRTTGDCHFADSEEAESKLGVHGAAEILLSQAFREAQNRKCDHLVILGDPGSGKTTHLKRLLLACLRQGPASLGLAEDTLPVFLPLRDLDDIKQGIPAFIEKTLDSPHLNMPQGFGKRLLQRGHLLLLFDGLDEVSDARHRAEVAGWIEKAVKDWPDCTAVVTCRFAGYDEDSRLNARFLELHLRPLTEVQSKAFIRNWYKAVEARQNPGIKGENLAAENAKDLIERLRGSDFRSARMATMTRNPLLLTNLCLVHRDRHRILPKNRLELYDECIEVLLERWRGAKPLKDGQGLSVSIPAAVGRKALQPVAFWLHSQEGRTRASAAELAPVLEPALKAAQWVDTDAKRFLKTLRDESGLLTGWSHDQYGFMHLGFQEYLAARELYQRGLAEVVQGKPATLAELAKHFGESWWQEVILLLLAYQGDYPLYPHFMAEALNNPRMAEDTVFLGLMRDEAVGQSAEPFLSLLRQAPGQDRTLWAKQLTALRALQSLDPDAIPALAETLKTHPLPELRGLLPGRVEAPQHTRRSDQGEVELVYLPGGRYTMGSPEGQGYDDERPAHEVEIQPFYLGRYPVTNEEYACYLKANPDAKEPAYWADRRFNQARQPVVGIGWEEAQGFARWAGGRLPTEAEWEYAARAGTTTEYFWGDSEDEAGEYAWYSKNAQDTIHPVGEKRANPFGLFDMAGNVWEWTQDRWHDNYNGAPVDGSAWDSGDSGRRVVRGGSWYYEPGTLRSATRNWGNPDNRDNLLGFRLAQDL